MIIYPNINKAIYCIDCSKNEVSYITDFIENKNARLYKTLPQKLNSLIHVVSDYILWIDDELEQMHFKLKFGEHFYSILDVCATYRESDPQLEFIFPVLSNVSGEGI